MNAKAIAICIATGVLRVTIIVTVLGRERMEKVFGFVGYFYFLSRNHCAGGLGLGRDQGKAYGQCSSVPCSAAAVCRITCVPAY